MKVSIVIPCYNERPTIETLLLAVESSLVEDKEVIVVDDFSDDGTREYLQNDLEDHYDQLILQEANKGKGAALRAGFAQATGEIILTRIKICENR